MNTQQAMADFWAPQDNTVKPQVDVRDIKFKSAKDQAQLMINEQNKDNARKARVVESNRVLDLASTMEQRGYVKEAKELMRYYNQLLNDLRRSR